MIRTLLFGMGFGFILSRVGATDVEAISAMFSLEDLHLAGVIGVAIVVSAPLLWLLRRRGIACAEGCSRPLVPKARKPGNVVGGLIFGAGWALTGTCPGTALAQLGEGQGTALFTLLGIVVGTGLYARVGRRLEARIARLSLWVRSSHTAPAG